MTATLDDLLAVLNQIRDLLNGVFGPAKSVPQIEFFTVNNTAAAIATGGTSKPCKQIVLQNLSVTDTITLGIGKAGKPAALTAGKGMVLNPAQSSGYGGGSITLLNVDLADITAITSTNNSQTLGGLYYQ
jgi:hypothetical protein